MLQCEVCRRCLGSSFKFRSICSDFSYWPRIKSISSISKSALKSSVVSSSWDFHFMSCSVKLMSISMSMCSISSSSLMGRSFMSSIDMSYCELDCMEHISSSIFSLLVTVCLHSSLLISGSSLFPQSILDIMSATPMSFPFLYTMSNSKLFKYIRNLSIWSKGWTLFFIIPRSALWSVMIFTLCCMQNLL